MTNPVTKCFRHLQLSIKKKLEEFMATLGRNLTPAQRETIETTGTIVARDNVELACAFIQKKAVEKALPEIDKRLKVSLVLPKRYVNAKWNGQ